MPKQQLLISRFEGGLNTDSDPRDILENQFSVLDGFSVSSIGKIKTLGAFRNSNLTSLSGALSFGQPMVGNDVDANVFYDDEWIDMEKFTSPGYGLYSFSSDFDMSGRGSMSFLGSGGTVVGTDMKATDILLYMDGHVGYVYTEDTGWLYQLPFGDDGNTLITANDSAWGNDDAGSFNYPFLVPYGEWRWSFYAPNGDVRMCDGNFEHMGTFPYILGNSSGQILGQFDSDGNLNNKAVCSKGLRWYFQTAQTAFAPFQNNPAASGDAGPASNLVMHNGLVDGDGETLTGASGGDATDRALTFFTTDSAGTFGGDANNDVKYSESAWGIGLAFSERLAGTTGSYTGQNGSGTWQPESNIRYKFWATVVYEGNQESSPLPFLMHGSQTATAGTESLERNTEIQFLSTFAATHTHDDAVVGHNMSVHFKPIIRLAGDEGTHGEYKYVFGGMSPASGFQSAGATYPTRKYIDLAGLSAGNDRIIGSRIYWSESVDGHDNLWIMFDLDWVKGCKPFGMGEFTTSSSDYHAWDQVATTGVAQYHFEPDNFANNRFYDPPRLRTYESINGFSHKTNLEAKWKTAVVANGRAYIANLKRPATSMFARNMSGAQSSHGPIFNQSDREWMPEHPDRLCKSPVGKYDQFPEENDFELLGAGDDGDEIIKLETYADRLFVFKKYSLYILNISRDTEVLEGTYRNLGLDGGEHCQSVVTDSGVAWMNSNGVYFYNGNNIESLTDGKIKSLWVGDDNNTAFWKSAAGDMPSIGQDPRTKKLICAKNIEDVLDYGLSQTNELLVYDFTKKSWSQIIGGMDNLRRKTNFQVFKDRMLMIQCDEMSPQNGTQAVNDWSSVTDWEDRTWVTQLAEIKEWADAPFVDTNSKLYTKDIDFGAPSVRKKIYKVYLSYKGDGTGLTIRYAINGDTDDPSTTFESISVSGASVGPADSTPLVNAGTDDWLRAELKPSASINNIFSFQFQILGTATANFEINDLTIIYRMKSIK